MAARPGSRGEWPAAATLLNAAGRDTVCLEARDRVGHSLFGHPLSQRPALGDRLHWASTETATERAGHIEGALSSGERAALAVLAVPSGADEPGTGVIAPARRNPVVMRRPATGRL
ncbi:hypothetical protein [Streptomyces olivaceoviridis]|uniref:hypothetical protein n=1 Tax=Streptomyces olivaceoviridis TaxID=1921 RepID=UPI0037B95396